MRILVFQHVDVEHPGVFREFWREAGHSWTPVLLTAGEPLPSPDGFDLLMVMGGPMDVWQEEAYPWLIAEKAAIRHWVAERGLPYLGICLGHQLLAGTLGGEVGLMPRPEVGLSGVELTAKGLGDPALKGFAKHIETFQWHGAQVAKLPEGAELLASNAACPVQALRYGRCAYGFQFHCEITETTVADWEAIPEYHASLDRALGAEGAAQLGSNVRSRLPAFRESARMLNENLMTIANDGRNPI